MSSPQVDRSVSLGRQLRVMARMVKVEHSVFALPFAYIGIFLAAGGWPGARPKAGGDEPPKLSGAPV